MSRRQAVVALGFCWACTASGPTPPAPPAPEVAETPKPKVAAGSCAPAEEHEKERLTLSENSAASIASGLQVHFVGWSHDSHMDGSTDMLVEMAFSWGTQSDQAIVSGLARPQPDVFHRSLDHCWRLVEFGDSAVVEIAIAQGAPSSLAACPATPAPDTPLLDDYGVAEKGARFTATLRYDREGHQWAVDPLPRMPHHHASRIEWSGLAQHGRNLALASAREVLATFKVTEKHIEKVPAQRRWNTTVHAALESICAP